MLIIAAVLLTHRSSDDAKSAFATLTQKPHGQAGTLAGLRQPLPRSRPQATVQNHALEDSITEKQASPKLGAAFMPGAVATIAALVAGLRQGTKRRQWRGGNSGDRFLTRVAAEGDAVAVPKESAAKMFSTVFCNLFAVWLAIAAMAAIKHPASFTWVKSSYFTFLLGALMFSVGITTTIDDFKECFKRPGAVAINFLSCYGIMPVLAFVIAKLIRAEGAILAGLVLVGSINGGQASNLCTLIAGGDVALSVLMTTSTTIGCIFMTPLICKLVLGAVVPVDALGIVVSTFQVVLAPIFLGVGLNTLAPRFCKSVAPFTPVVGVIATVLLVGASVAKCAEPIVGAGLPLQLACLALHLIGGLLGYSATSIFGYDERTCRTVAIETAMKSSAFGFLLASLHFGVFNVRVPSAVSVVWMAITGSVLAVYWKGGKPAGVA
jgi:BASS family bile acid:Na+ symporter